MVLNIGILAYENCLLSGIAGAMDLFAVANWEQRRRQPAARQPFCRCEILTSDGQPVTSFNRLPLVPKGGVRASGDLDLVLVPGIMGRPELLLEQTELVAWLAEQHQRGTVIASACSGAFLLAEAGILNRRPATTHWQLADRFRQRYPKIKLQVEQLLIDGGDYLCAGGTSAHLDLALYLVEKFASAALADACARMMLLDPKRRDQAPFARFRGCKDHADRPILQVQKWLESRYREKVSVRQMAKLAGLNERTFLRRFRKATGEAPLEYLQRLRIEQAKRLLADGNAELEEITQAVGYVDASSFRRLFKQLVGVTPIVYRKRFGGL